MFFNGEKGAQKERGEGVSLAALRGWRHRLYNYSFWHAFGVETMWTSSVQLGVREGVWGWKIFVGGMLLWDRGLKGERSGGVGVLTVGFWGLT